MPDYPLQQECSLAREGPFTMQEHYTADQQEDYYHRMSVSEKLSLEMM